MEPLGPVVSSDQDHQVPGSLDLPSQNLKVPLNLGASTEEKASIAHKGETKKQNHGRCLTFFFVSTSLRHKNSN